MHLDTPDLVKQAKIEYWSNKRRKLNKFTGTDPTLFLNQNKEHVTKLCEGPAHLAASSPLPFLLSAHFSNI